MGWSKLEKSSDNEWQEFLEQPEINSITFHYFCISGVLVSVRLCYRSSPQSHWVRMGWSLSPAWLYCVQVWDPSSPPLCEHADRKKTYTNVLIHLLFKPDIIIQTGPTIWVDHNASWTEFEWTGTYLSSWETWKDFNKNLKQVKSRKSNEDIPVNILYLMLLTSGFVSLYEIYFKKLVTQWWVGTPSWVSPRTLCRISSMRMDLNV